MKQASIYICEFCDAHFIAQKDCETHEATHYGLTRREYLDWRILCREAAAAGHRVGVSSTPETRDAFDKAIERLYRFEQKHHIDATIKPSDFFLY